MYITRVWPGLTIQPQSPAVLGLMPSVSIKGGSRNLWRLSQCPVSQTHVGGGKGGTRLERSNRDVPFGRAISVEVERVVGDGIDQRRMAIGEGRIGARVGAVEVRADNGEVLAELGRALLQPKGDSVEL